MKGDNPDPLAAKRACSLCSKLPSYIRSRHTLHGPAQNAWLHQLLTLIPTLSETSNRVGVSQAMGVTLRACFAWATGAVNTPGHLTDPAE